MWFLNQQQLLLCSGLFARRITVARRKRSVRKTDQPSASPGSDQTQRLLWDTGVTKEAVDVHGDFVAHDTSVSLWLRGTTLADSLIALCSVWNIAVLADVGLKFSNGADMAFCSNNLQLVSFFFLKQKKRKKDKLFSGPTCRLAASLWRCQ